MTTTRLTRRVLRLFLGVVIAQTTVASTATAAPTTATTGNTFQVEQQLAALRFDVGAVDGVVDARTSSAVMAFQKVYGLPRTGQLTDGVATQILAPQTLPPPLVPNGGPSRVEVDLGRQVLFLYEGGALSSILAVSSGTAATPTPTGAFRFYRYDPGWHTSRLGQLYNAVYFYGGYAIHGSGSVPAQPASHGCIRISLASSQWFPSHVSTSTAVYVLSG